MKKVFLILFFCLIAGESIGSSPGDFETLVKYDIKGMSADNTIVLDFNGFNCCICSKICKRILS